MDRAMIFVDHSNLFNSLRRKAEFRGVTNDRLITLEHCKSMVDKLMRGRQPGEHKEGNPPKPAHVLFYIPDEPKANIWPPQRKLIAGIKDGLIPGAWHRGGRVEHERPDVCRAKVPPDWSRECGNLRKERTEKMIDVWLTTDLVRCACKREYDIAVLVTCDRDFIPAVTTLQKHEGIRVMNAFIEPTALTGMCLAEPKFFNILPIFSAQTS